MIRTLIGLTTLALLATTPTFTAAPAESGVLLVANQRDATATLIKLDRQHSVAIPVGNGPHETAVSPDGRWGVVTIYGTQTPGNELAIVDVASEQVVRRIDLGEYRRPHGAAFVAGSSTLLAVTSEASQKIVLVDVAKGEIVDTIATNHPGSHMLGLTSDGARAFTANVPWGGISELNLRTKAFVRDLNVAPATEGIAVAPDGGTVWVGSNKDKTVSVVDTKTWSVAATLDGFKSAYRIGISPDGRLAVICDPEGNRVHVADVRARKVIGPIEIDGFPLGVSIAPDSATAFITLGQANAVAAVDLTTRKELWRKSVGLNPDGVAYGPRSAPPM